MSRKKNKSWSCGKGAPVLIFIGVVPLQRDQTMEAATSICPFPKLPGKSRTLLCSNVECVICYKKSFADHPHAKRWSPDNPIQARFVTKGSSKKYKLICDRCAHAYTLKLYSENTGPGCPYCSKPAKRLCNEEKCAVCTEKSYASHPNAKFWSSENPKSPRQVFKQSGQKYKFNCETCGHTFESRLKGDSWCPFCSNKKLCDEKKSCEWCLQRSFKKHPKSEFWSSKNTKSPSQVHLHSVLRVIFDCPDCKKEYVSRLRNVSRGHWCPCTKNKTETKLNAWLCQEFKHLEFTKQARFKWCKSPASGHKLRFDMYCRTLAVVIELDGLQHFEQVLNWKSPVEQYTSDAYKMKCLTDHGKSVVRLEQVMVWQDTAPWQGVLHKLIQDVERKTIQTPFVHYISKDEKLYATMDSVFRKLLIEPNKDVAATATSGQKRKRMADDEQGDGKRQRIDQVLLQS